MKQIAIIGLVAWIAGVAIGAREIYAYSTRPGEVGLAPKHWPSDSTLALGRDRTTLVIFVHPDCPCTRASLAELREIVATAGDRAAIRIVMPYPGDAWEAAGRIAGAERILDPLAHESERFGARTSGHVVVYDATGALRYAGGITGARGHRGDNVGRRIVQRIVAGERDHEATHPVYGCALRVPGAGS